ncbi:AAA family ATPase [Fictibacillus aquaticus]|uniref:Shikimate kinase n=1 Tax=Fictibacillus aquaticus TaxID=2021314 RepID=A0A235F7Q4_9BACL|nr:AAA family ATPase [Fictibacillus aquaticus]OYD57262.1 shikimate kinase [Fictibacillus aquaticus]
MKFILLFGPQAAGKMTIGHELEKTTQLKLFHNHMTIDLIVPFFDYGTKPFNRLVNLFREEMFEEAAKSNMYGLIFTYVWAFNEQSDWDFVNRTVELFESYGAEVYFVELESELNTRLERNRTEHRLQHKPTKRDLEWSDHDVVTSMEKYRLNSRDGEITRENYIKINNTNLSAAETAELIKTRFQL